MSKGFRQRRKRGNRHLLFAAAAGAAHLIVARSAWADDNWVDQGGGGSWSIGFYWSEMMPPGSGETANLVNDQTYPENIDYDESSTTTVLSKLTISNSGGSYEDLQEETDPGVLSVSDFESIGGNSEGVTGAGEFFQSTGVNTVGEQLVLGANSGDDGTYYLMGGTLSATGANSEEFIGFNGTGTFNQSNGLNTFAGTVDIGNFTSGLGSYNLSSVGTLTTTGGAEHIGGLPGSTGTFTQSGGANMINAGNLDISTDGGVGNYNMSGGTLSLNTGNTYPSYLIVGGGAGQWATGTFTQSGGRVNLNSTFLSDGGSYFLITGTLTANGGSETVGETAGDAGSGIFVQSGGDNSIEGSDLNDYSGALYLGPADSFSTGTYELQGGILNTGPAYIGFGGGGTGLLIVSNTGEMFVNSVNYGLTLANGSIYAYNEIVGGGGASTVASIMIGLNSGTGLFTQTGGTNNGAELDIGGAFQSMGTYNLSGGLASVVSVVVGYPAQGGELYVPGGTGYLNVVNTGQMTVNTGVTFNNGTVSATNETIGGGSASNASIVIGPGILGVGTFNQFGGRNTVLAELDLGVATDSIGTYNVSGGSASVGDSVQIGYLPYNPRPFQTVQGGTGFLTVSNTGQMFVSNSVVLNNGAVSASASEFLGGGSAPYPTSVSIEIGPESSSGVGTFNQTGGTNTTPDLYLGYAAESSGIYNLGGGTLTVAGDEFVGSAGEGSFTQIGGLNQIGGSLFINSHTSNYSNYDLGNSQWPDSTLMFTDAGTNIIIGSKGQLSIYGNTGTIAFNQPLPGMTAPVPSTFQGGYLMDPNATISIGPHGRFNNYGGYIDPAALDLCGSFTQTSGIANFGQINDDGAISVSGGLVVATAGEYVGNNATGSFSLSSAINIIGNSNGLVVGNSSGSTGWYTLGALGTLTSGGSEIVGLNGAGGFDQGGGVNTIATNGFYYLTLGNNAGATGSYTLSGTGSLSSSYEFVGAAGAGTFNQGGGTNTVNVSLSIGNNPGGMGLYAMNAGTLTAGQIADGPVGTATFNQSGGLVTVGAAGLSLGANAGSTGTYALSGGVLQVNGNVYVGGSSTGAGGTGVLTVSNSGQLSVAGTLKVYSTGRVNLDVPSISVGNLAIAGNSSININGALTINYGAPGNDPVSSIVTLLKNGYDGGAWTGTAAASIVSTSVSAGYGKPVLSVGYADGNADNGTAAGPNQIVVRYTMAGDANLDGHVNSADLLAVIQNFNKTGTDWAHGNFTYIASGQSTTSADLLLVIQNFNQTLPPPAGSDAGIGTLALSASAPVQGNAPLPEPGVVSVMLAGLAGLLRKRRRRRGFLGSKDFWSPGRRNSHDRAHQSSVGPTRCV